jgi:uncharacterized protein YfaS (alpha-2-macroglobulin family)
MKNSQFKRSVLICLALFGSTLILCGVFYSLSVSSQTQELSFGYGLPVQLVDPSGRNSVQFMAYDAPLSATLQLYSLSPGQFISSYNTLPAWWWEDAHLDPTGLPLVAEWQEAVTSTYHLQATALPSVPLGFYLLTIGDSVDVQDELMVILSHDTLLLKASASGDTVQVVAWASRLSTGEPLPGTAITIYDDAGQALASGATDANGLYEAHITGADPQSLLAVGATSEGLSACGTRYEWNSGDGWFGATSSPPHKVYLYTDRPIYRPGHTVHYKGILRHDDDGDYTPLTTQAVTVSVRDARENVLLTIPASPSSFGTISGSFTLADEPGLGEYHLEVLLNGHTYRQPFKVEEYRKPDYAVTVSTSHDFYILGDLMSVTVASDYYFGQPVVGAEVQFTLYGQEWGNVYPVWETTGTTDAQGRWTTTINSADYASGDATFILEATVSDESNQVVSNNARVPIHYAEYSLSMRLNKYGYAPDEAIPVNLQALAHDGVPVVGVPLTVTVWTWTYDGDYVEVSQALGTTDETGAAQVTFQISEPGWYRLQAQGQDGRGRTVTAQGWFWVYSSGWGWSGQPDDELTVSADKDSYAPGEVAQLLVRSPVTGTALLSLERGRTRQAYPVLLSDTVSLITLPIGSDYAPNLFATVNVFQRGWEPEDYYGYESSPEGRLLLDSVELIVPASERVLQVELRPDKTTYRPRETVTFTIQVRDQAGEPVAAEVSLGLVDEAIYALSDDLSADIHETFYGRRDDDVVSYDSLRPRRSHGWVGGTEPAPTGTPGPVGDDLDDDDGDVRRDFPDTAYWNPGVLTDPQGQAIISLTLPDNLTRWRALARAVSVDTRVGEATTAITVTQELIVRPTLPRFLIQGDLVRLRAIAHNYLSHAITATLELSTSGLVMLGADCGTVACTPPPMSLPPGGTGVSDWSAVASELGQGSVLARLRAGDGTLDTGGDAVELPLPVQPFAVPEIISRVGQVEHEITETLYLSVTAIPGATSLRIRLSSSIALGLLDGLEYLIGYPYG